MDIVAFPQAIKVDVLEKHNPGYHSDKLALYNALYEGGDSIHGNKNILEKLLPIRSIEQTPEAKGQYEKRKIRAFYVNRPNKLISWMTAACFPSDPTIVTEPYSEYFDSLNTNADGLGTHFCTVARNSLRDMMIGHRSYFHVFFPEAEDKVSADDMKALSARINNFSATPIDDWSYDKDGRMEWCRAHNVELVRDPSNPFAQAEKERHTWTYYTKTNIAIYEFICDIGGQHDDSAVAVLMPSTLDHDFGLPIFDIRCDKSLWIMDKISDIIRALFQREAGVTWGLDTQCYPIPYVAGQQSKLTISGSELLAVQLDSGATMGFAAPSPTIFDPLFKDCERLTQDLFETCQSMSISAATIPQAGRLSSSAIESFKEPTLTLLEAFSQPIKEAALRTLNAIAKYRGENVEITLEGFDAHADVDEEDLKDLLLRKDDKDEQGEGSAERGGGEDGDKAGSEAAGKKD